jgi:hypothetical protein
MKKVIVDAFIGKKVSVKINDEIITGTLEKTGTIKFKNDPNLFIPKNYYVVIDPETRWNSFLFRSSSIKKIEEIK